LFKLWFGRQDRLQLLIDRLAERSSLSDNARLDEVQNAAAMLSNADLAILEDFVPHRFLTPWLRSALAGVKDHAKHGLIQLLAERSAHSPRPAPYSFDSVIGRPRTISIGSKLLSFLQSNHLPLKAFAQLSLAKYFEVRNPGIPGITNKLERPGARKLDKAREFWDTILEHLPLYCIYSGNFDFGRFALFYCRPFPRRHRSAPLSRPEQSITLNDAVICQDVTLFRVYF
jgi:hypothetical protein